MACALALVGVGLASAGTAGAKARRPLPTVAKGSATAVGTGAVGTATVSCPKKLRDRHLGPWRATAGSYDLNSSIPPGGSGVVYESYRVGKRSWRISVQSTRGTIGLDAFVTCIQGGPKTNTASSTTPTPGTAQVGPTAIASCPSGNAVSGGFSTPPPVTSSGLATAVVGSSPSGATGWQAQVVSSQPSSVTSYVYCAKHRPLALSATSPPTTIGHGLADVNSPVCPGKHFVEGGGFSEQGLTSSDYLLVRSSANFLSKDWEVRSYRIGSAATDVAISAHVLCG